MTKMYFTKFVSMILTVALCLQVLIPGVSASAVTDTDDNPPIYMENIYGGVNLDELSDSDIVCENEESRNAYSKTFRLVNGTNVIAVYDTLVHEQDENGVWQEIDNSLEETNDGYENKKSSLKVKFFKNPTSGNLYTVKGQDYQISWGLSNVNRAAIQVQKQPNAESDTARKLSVKSQSELVRYGDILPYVDMEYKVTGSGVKENICLKDKRATTSFSFSLKTDNLQTVLENNEIVLSRDGETVYTISAPYMVDADGHKNNNLKFELSGGPNQYTVTLLPDTEWLKTAVYPVIIDPVLSKYMSHSEIHSTSVTSSGQNLYQYGAIVVGREASEYELSRGYFKFDLPTQFTSADRVIQAQLRLYTRRLLGAGPVTVNVRKVVNNFNLSTATWNTVVNCCANGPVIDSYTVAQNGVFPVAFDITTAVRSWYQDGANYGLEFISDGESSLDYRYTEFYTEASDVISSKKPSILIQYANYSGIEDVLTYHTAGNDRMGMVSVSDYTGNMVYTLDDVSTTGNYFPVSVSHVFDSSRRNNVSYCTGATIFGTGFRLNLYERIMSSSVQDRPYMYIDADGTCHYFKYKSGSGTEILYEDEFYPSRIITRYSDSSGNPTSFKLTDGSNIETFFTFNGFMNRKRDVTNGKQMWVEFVSGTAIVSKVHDGGGHVISFEYDSNKYLTKMTDPAGRSITYTYTNGRLTKITRPGNRNINLSYNTNGSLLSVTDVYGAKVNIEYWANTYNGSNSLLRVKTLTEKGSNGTEGQKLTFNYTAGQTIVTDRNARKERLMFDHLGHTVSREDPDGNGAFCKYATPEQYTGLSNTTNLHLLNYDVQAQGTVRNYVPNPDFEDSTLSPWVFENSTESGTGSASRNTSEKYAGNASMKVQSTSLTGRYGYQNPLTIPNVAAGKVYTISAYVKVTSITLSNSSLSGAIVYFGYHAADGWKLVRSKPIQSVTDGWVRISATMTVPSNWDSTYRITAKAGIEHAIGTAYFDNVQVEEGAVANNYNLLDNGYFRDAAGTATPFAWAGSGLSSANDKVFKDSTGWYFKITGERQKYKNIQQTVTISGNSGDKFTFGAWVRANAMNIPDPNSDGYRALAVRIIFVNTNGTEGAKYYYFFEGKTDQLQFLAGEARATAAYSAVKIALLYNLQQNAAYFKDIQLFKEGCKTSYTNDAKGRLKTVTDESGKVTTYTYATADTDINADGRISNIAYPDGTSESYTYDNSKRILTHTDAAGVTTTYLYDSNGNPTGSETTSSATTQKLKSNTTVYSGAYATGSTDVYGNSVTQTVDNVKGLVNSTTDAKGTLTSYTYSPNTDQPTGVVSGDSKIAYAYTLDRLSDIGHNTTSSTGNTTATSADVQYNITYDEYGNRDTVRVGGALLSDNTYGSYNGPLQKTQYGNNDYREFTYDVLDRVTAKKYNGVVKYKWEYDYKGNVGLHNDLQNGMDYRFEYDSSGRLTRSYGTPTTAGTFPSITYSNVYDSAGRLTRSVHDYMHPWGGATRNHIFNYTQSTGRLWREFIVYGERFFNYDELGRIQSISVDHLQNGVTTPLYSRNYTYYTSGDTTTGRIIYENVSGQGVNYGWSYTYDKNGNIDSITSAGRMTIYSYDSLNQLLSANNGINSFAYTYDKGGNILTKTVNGTTVNYLYNNPNWGDLLTGYAGQTFTYDAIGNPLTYRDGMSFSWNGRELVSGSVNNTSISYSYNSDGIRMSKTVDGVTTYYSLDGEKVVAQKTGNTVYYFEYDLNGAPFLLYKDGVSYYYILNGQGDVIAITDASGNVVTEYTYDPWGNILSVTGSLSSTIGADNPLRYRGYFYDSETGLYYLNSRYYDPVTGRFLNADGYVSTGQGVLGYNMFAYCNNNPIIREDNGGEFWNIIIGAAVGGIVGGIVAGVTSYMATGKVDWGSVAINFAVGAACGAIAATGLGAIAQAGLTATVSGIGNAAEQIYTNKGFDNFNALEVLGSSIVGGGTALLGTGLGKVVGNKINNAGTALLNKGKDKLLTSMIRESVGQSHSALKRQGIKYISQGMVKINTFRGISSVIGSGVSLATVFGYNTLGERLMKKR